VNSQPIDFGCDSIVIPARTGSRRSSFWRSAAERHSVMSSDGPASNVGFRSGIPCRVGLSLLSTGADALTLTFRSTRSLLKKMPRMPLRSAFRNSPR
jgi:hypothetical protein